MKTTIFFTLLVISKIALAAEIQISATTPAITPTENIYVFPTVDWNAIETRQDASKSNVASTVMECGDSSYTTVEIKLDFDYVDEKSGLEGVSIESGNCSFEGANVNKFSPTWLHFSGPLDGNSCEIILKKERNGGRTPLKMKFEIHDAC